MLDYLIELDRNLFVCLNGLGSERWDAFFLHITKQLNWWPYFLLLIFLLLKKITPKQFLLLVLVLAAFFVFTDQMTNLVKNTVERFRPVNDPGLKDMIRVVKSSSSWSFFSGHASNSSGSTLILFLILRKYYKYAFLMFLFPLLFAYTRIYLGLHFPGDILAGYAFGLMSGFGFYKLFCYLHTKYNLTDR
ncbi:phosphatase PAP2 family protein [Flavobacterium soli]|uniref:phosphatase PAP2 family protein n=1 Tax=Flavobacterium soli TaxID=344881 RepID=UPI000419F3D6|nr:phosphatase PAP2 family protein [Flavobacterium soli]